jgi:gamma-glutamyltranspeptidase/glutathione hydrolase
LKKALTFPSRRSPTLARQGMVATSQPLAAMAGLRILMEGGNAADAAIAVAAMLNVVEPMSTGIGGDCFALVYQAQSGQVTCLNGSGRAPASFGLEEAQRLGLRSMPFTGPLPVTVPGAASGWEALLNRYGSMTLADCLAPAIATAEEGFPVTERISAGWQRAAAKLAKDPEAARIYLPAPRPGQIHRQPDLGRTFRTVAEGGAQAFYHGDLATKITEFVQARGGYLNTQDLATHNPKWEVPLRTSYRGTDVLEHPPNGQGLAALLALNIVEGYDLAEMDYYASARWHLMIEAMRIGMADAAHHVADPAVMHVPVERLLSKEYAAQRRASVRSDRILDLSAPAQIEHQDTVYLTVVDGKGNAVSFINSLFHGFGSGLVVPGTGICLQNRGACFRLEADHPNALAGGKRPYHTIIPAMALREGQLWLSFGVMGGYMQPQGHLQVLSNLIDYSMSPQAALDAPRFRVNDRGGPELAIESGVPWGVQKMLRQVGHKVRVEETFAPIFGSGDIIARDLETGVLWGASDPRKDGNAVGW